VNDSILAGRGRGIGVRKVDDMKIPLDRIVGEDARKYDSG
jgi:hypothetical protein